ncbi:hypothetical protein LRAMOSA07384 [Lichtheimia ramosa]|uniref:Uncharacterized protein n=1 Tax=Lichtheimia ramosa TaxID=688394 RepID=A0A077WCH5_9FUNG|nr:hypothetical protein LRAMOSA07384 [Lichtheimia ramosa]
MLVKSLFTIVAAALASTSLACEPECRRGLAADFAKHYGPVVQLAVDQLQDSFASDVTNATLPSSIYTMLPENVLQSKLTEQLSSTLGVFVEEATGKDLTSGIFSVMFAEEKPFKGDCNHPARLTRKMPPPGESWTREECQKMDYICGNPPSICHFLPDIKQRILGRIRSQLANYATFDDGSLVKNVVQSIKQTTSDVMREYGAGSSMDDPEVKSYVDTIISNAIRSLDTWSTEDLKSLCTRPEDDQVCNGWDDSIITEILKWP